MLDSRSFSLSGAFSFMVFFLLLSLSFAFFVSADAAQMDDDSFDQEDSLLNNRALKECLEYYHSHEPDFQMNTFKSIENDRLVQALNLVNSGQLKKALEMIDSVVSQTPSNANAYELRGAVFALQGNLDKAVNDLKKSITINPSQSSAYTKLGDISLARNNTQSALDYFNKALQYDPEDRRAHQRVGIIYEEENKYKEAIIHFEKGIKGTPDHYLGVKTNLAGLYLLTGQPQKSINLIEPLVSESNQNIFAHLVLAGSFLRLGQYDKAIGRYSIAQKIDPKDPRSYLGLGIALRSKGEFEASLAEFRQLSELPNSSPASVSFQIGTVYAEMGNDELALQSFYNALKSAPNPGPIQLRISEIYLKQEKYNEAQELLKELINAGNPGVKAYDLLGTSYQFTQKYEQAESVFLKMIEKFPDNVFAIYKIGIFYGYIRKYNKAIEYLNTALNMDSNNVSVLKAISQSLKKTGDINGAISAAKRISELLPDSTGDKFYLASLYEDASQEQEAITSYQNILSQSPDHPAALNNLAVLYSKAGKLSEAETLSAQAVKRLPENGTILDTYGWILYQLDKPEEAYAVLTKAVKNASGNSEFLYHLGAVCFKLKRLEEAKKWIGAAIKLDVNFKSKEKALALMEKL